MGGINKSEWATRNGGGAGQKAVDRIRKCHRFKQEQHNSNEIPVVDTRLLRCVELTVDTGVNRQNRGPVARIFAHSNHAARNARR